MIFLHIPSSCVKIWMPIPSGYPSKWVKSNAWIKKRVFEQCPAMLTIDNCDTQATSFFRIYKLVEAERQTNKEITDNQIPILMSGFHLWNAASI